MAQLFPPLTVVDLLQQATTSTGPALLGRQRESDQLARILARQQHTNLLIVGKRGVGKSALVEGFAQAVATDGYPNLQPMPYLALEAAQITRLLRSADNEGALVSHWERAFGSLPASTVLIDDAETLLEEFSTPHVFSQLFSPFFVAVERRLILITEAEAWERLEDDFERFLKTFDVLQLAEMSDEIGVSILTDQAKFIAGRHKLKLAGDVPAAVYESAQQLPATRALPDRALRFFDEVCAATAVRGNTVVRRADVQQTLVERLGMPTEGVAVAQPGGLAKLPTRLASQVIGQAHATTAVAETVQRGWLGLNNPKRPIGSFLFLGPSGVGKTELARVLAQEVYGGERTIVRIDMSEYGEAHTVQRLVGAPPGYVGYEAGGQLTNPVLANPYSLILLDEIEKADPAVWDIFLQVLEDGRLTDGQGTTVDFRKTIIIATSNIGITDIVRAEQAGDDVTGEAWLKEQMMPRLAETFRLEFLNRFDSLVVFRPLGEEALLKIARLELDKIQERLAPRGVRVTLAPDILKQVVAQVHDPRFGARPLKRWLEKAAEQQVAQVLLKQQL